MANIPDEMLRDYVLDRLTPEARLAVEDLAQWDADLRARIARIKEQEALATPPRGANRPSFWAAAERRIRSHAVAAAAIMFAAGLIAGYAAQAFPSLRLDTTGVEDVSAEGMVVAALRREGRLHMALEELPNGSASPGGPVVARPLSAFLDPAGRFCREFDVSYGEGPKFSGVACRSRQGRWDLEILMPSRDAAATTGAYAPASGRSAELMANLLEALKKQPSLEQEQVTKLIQQRWRR